MVDAATQDRLYSQQQKIRKLKLQMTKLVFREQSVFKGTTGNTRLAITLFRYLATNAF